MCTLIDVTAANIGLEVLIACLAGTAEGPETVLTGCLGATIGQSRHGESKTVNAKYLYSAEMYQVIQVMLPGICALIDVHTFSLSALAHTLVSIITVLVLLTAKSVVSTP